MHRFIAQLGSLSEHLGQPFDRWQSWSSFVSYWRITRRGEYAAHFIVALYQDRNHIHIDIDKPLRCVIFLKLYY